MESSRTCEHTPPTHRHHHERTHTHTQVARVHEGLESKTTYTNHESSSTRIPSRSPFKREKTLPFVRIVY